VKKVGLYFGTYNPIHIGHLAIANFMIEFTDLEELWFVVSPHNPFKKKSNLLPDRTRLNLVYEAVQDDHRLKVSDIEFELAQPSYTIHTLTYLKEKHPDIHFCLIMGTDNLSSFPKWKNANIILQEHEIFTYPRLDHFKPELASHEHVHIMNAPVMEISSSFIRNAIREGHDMRHYMPAPVWREIERMNYYR
jgi:nicotinate-nucleotide adenylyltransferase